MRLKAKDWIATLLVAAIAVPYIGYLVRGEMPFIQDARGMSVTGLLLGGVAYWVFMHGDSLDRNGKLDLGLAVASAVLGVVAIVFAETAGAGALLALFMASIAVVWATTLVVHAGLLHRRAATGVAR